jgi:Fe-S cluster assembly protein SufD
MLFGLRQNDNTAFADHNNTEISENDFGYSVAENEGINKAFISLTKHDVSRKNYLHLASNSHSDFVYVVLYDNNNVVAQNIDTEIAVDDNSTLDMHIFCGATENADTRHNINIKIGKNSEVKLSVAVLAGKSVDTKINVDFNGENSSLSLPIILMPSQDEKFDFKTVVNHNVGHCISNQVVRAVVDKNGVSDFYGLVKVLPNAQKTETNQVNNNILLSDDARALSKPQLEIYADDVKCSHGSTTGMLDKDALFYMQSRGISEKTAQKLLLEAFINEITDSLDAEDYKNYLREQIAIKLG